MVRTQEHTLSLLRQSQPLSSETLTGGKCSMPETDNGIKAERKYENYAKKAP